MQTLNTMFTQGHEYVSFCYDKETDTKMIIAVHDTTLGPAVGGARMYPYDSIDAALNDVLRLSEGMTYKASVAGLDYGGGKAVIIGDPRKDKSEALFRAFGRFVESLGGKYITAEDVGTTVRDLMIAYQETRHVVGRDTTQGGSGDPSPVTAYGVYRGMQAAVKVEFGSDKLQGCTVALQGLGKVGYSLAKELVKAGTRVIAAEMNPMVAKQAQDRLGVDLVAPAQIYDVDCDIFAPCALGAIINDHTISRLRCRIVAGAANNQLAEPHHSEALQQRHILYIPDYVINAGGLISVVSDLDGYDTTEVYRRAKGIYDRVVRVVELAKLHKTTTDQAAQMLALERMQFNQTVQQTQLPRAA